MTNVLWRQYKDYSGCLIRGTAPIVPQDPSKHSSCAAWLTSEAEGPSYGYVQSYDGAGISAGLLHNVLVLPKDLAQGDLGALVRRMLDTLDHNPAAGPSSLAASVREEIGRQNWTLAPDGKFRRENGQLVSGADLRNWAAPPSGRVPRSGANWEQAKKVALLFHLLFADERTWRIQEDFAIAWLARGNRTAELEVYRRFSGQHDLDSFVALPMKAIPSEVHLAMCVYHSFSVNSPKVAAECLARAWAAEASQVDHVRFAKHLVRELGTRGRDAWHDEPGDGSNRYDRTRLAVWGHTEFFPGDVHEIMPRDL
jgi:hypothetical protein